MLKKLFSLLVSVCLTISVARIPVWATEGQEEEGLEELLFTDIPVVVTSTLIEQSMSRAPSIMTVLREDEIALLGAKTLGELLNYVVGVEVQHGTTMDNIVTMRALRNDDDNGKVLFMVDGHTMNVPRNGNWHSWGLAGVKQVEIIRGPGSAIYGDHAMGGVVNIITKKPADLDGCEVTAGGGTNETFHTSVVAGSQLNEDSGYRFIFEKFDTIGSRDSIIENDRQREYWDPRMISHGLYGAQTNTPGPGWEGKFFQTADILFEHKNAYFRYRQEETAFEMLTNQNRAYLTDHPSTYFDDNWSIETGISFDFESWGKFSIKGWHDDLTQSYIDQSYVDGVRWGRDTDGDGVWDSFDTSTYSTSDGIDDILQNGSRKDHSFFMVVDGADIKYQTKLFNIHNILLGWSFVEHTSRGTDRYYQSSSSAYTPWGDEYWHSANSGEVMRINRSFYFQDLIALGDKMDVVLGGRHDEYTDFGNAFNPRFGVVYAFSDYTSLKVLYATAFRAPTVVEKHNTSDSTRLRYGAPPLTAEEVETTEVNFNTLLMNDKLMLNLTAFRNIMHGLITGTTYSYVSSSGTTWFTTIDANSGRAKVQGTELEMKYLLSTNFSVYMSHAWLDAEEKNMGVKYKIYDQPVSKTHVGFNWNMFENRVNWGCNAYHATERPRPTDHPLYKIKKAEAFTLVDTTILFKNFLPNNALDISFTVRNLFNEGYEVTNIGMARSRMVPTVFDVSRPGRSYFAKATVRF